MSVLFVLTQMPDRESAESLARSLLDGRLAACANILPPCRSIYRWRNAVEAADEVPLLIKTTEARYAEVQAAIRAGHPYELPEIVALPVAAGLPGYLAWVAAETGDGESST